MKKGIAFFDFDGTITNKDTLLEFIIFCRGRLQFYLGFLLHIHYLVGYKLSFIPNQLAKEKILKHFFKNTPLENFNDCCQRFMKERLPSLIRKGAIAEIQKLKANGYVVVVVTASPENWIRNWSEQYGIELIASILEVNNGKITGKIIGKNCHGDEKVRRITERYQIKDFEDIKAYGDSPGDRPMLMLATSAYYKPFRS